ncbi:MAG TPA: Gfo/Idh/MocA family oxidoreductase [Thermoanaerobaculia bacterium]
MKVGVVGTGYLGRLHARVLTEIPGITVAGFVETNDAIASEVASALKIKRLSSIAELAANADCAVVATPTSSHFSVASELLEAGCDVMIEKPVTADAREAEKLIEIAAKRGRIIQVGHVERYNPAIIAVADLVSESRFMEADRIGVFSGRSLDIDVLLDLMIHDLNLVLSLLKQEVVEIRAVGVPVLTEKVDMTNVRLELANGAVANLTASRVSQDRVRKQRFFGSDFYVSIDTKEQEAKGYKLVGKTLQPLDVAVTKKEPLRAELEAFIDCVRTRTRPLVTAEDGLAAVVLAHRVAAAIDSSMKRWRE